MSNHVHLVAVPKREASLGEALRDAHTMYASYFNARTEFSGHVWQGRFHSCPLDDDHLWASLRYVEMNPVRAGLVRHAEQYRWSSAAAHCGVLTDPVLARDLPCMDKMGDWADWLNQPGDEAYQTQCKHLRRQTHTGRPCGANEFLEQVEKLVQRPLKPAKRGRPFKNKS
jgi:putative transposase